MDTQGPLAIIWVSAGLIAFYIALIWINSLLGLFLTPLFLIPLTWLKRKRRRAGSGEEEGEKLEAARRPATSRHHSP